MLGELSKEIKAQLYDRARSPLFGGFTIAWIAWNFRAVLVTFSDLTYKEKIATWNDIYPDLGTWFLFAIAYPLLSAVMFILIYPHPARWVFKYWYSQHKELKKVQQLIEDATPLTQAEANALRRTAIEEQSAAQKQMTEMVAKNKELSEQNRVLNENIVARNVELDKALRQVDELINTPTSLGEKSALDSSPIDVAKIIHEVATASENSAPARTTLESILDPIPVATRANLTSKFPLLKEDTIFAVLLGLVAAGGVNVTAAHLASYFHANLVDIQYALERLEAAKFVHNSYGNHSLTPQTRELAVQLDLTKLVPRFD